MDPLGQLKDIHLPAQVNQWPISLGWWLLLIALLLVLIILVKKIMTKRKLQQVQRQAIKQLSGEQQLPTEQTLALLKWASMHYFTRTDVAAKHSIELLDFLSSKLNTEQQQQHFRTKAEDALVNCYRKSTVDLYAEDFQVAALYWFNNANFFQPTEKMATPLTESKELTND